MTTRSLEEVADDVLAEVVAEEKAAGLAPITPPHPRQMGMKVLISQTTYRQGKEPRRPEHKGVLVMQVWWSDGRVTFKYCADYGLAYDIIGGEAHPYENWEIWGVAS